jgi:hypothetical protein
MLAMTTGQVGHPITLLILVVPHDRLLHGATLQPLCLLLRWDAYSSDGFENFRHDNSANQRSPIPCT